MYTYIQIPFCKSKCTYCDFFSVVSTEENPWACNTNNSITYKPIVPDEYVLALLKEAKYRVTKHNIHSWKSLYFGGGTPGLLTTNQIKTLLTGLMQLCPLDTNAEVTFEVNPYEIAKDNGFLYLQTLSKYGVNRISCGIQALNDSVLLHVNRRSNKEECIKALETLSKWKNEEKSLNNRILQYSIDLITGLPYLTMDSFMKSLETVLSYDPNHISLYSLILEENTPLFKEIENNSSLYNEDDSDSQWLLGKEILQSRGYIHYEVSNFAKEVYFESEHNKAYWRMDDYVGLGAAACGTVGQDRFTGTRDIQSYINFWNNVDSFTSLVIDNSICEHEILKKEDRMFEYLMMGFRTRQGVNEDLFFNRFNCSLEERLGSAFKMWEQKGLAEKQNGYFSLNEKGLLYLNAFLSEII